MSILPDHELLRYNADPELTPLVEPFKQEHLQPASIDLTLDRLFVRYTDYNIVDLADVSSTAGSVRKYNVDYYTLRQQEFVLGSTAEYVRVPDSLVGTVEGKSSLARLGLLVHVTAGFIDPGFQGKITLEFFNCGQRPIILRPGLRICQVSFTTLTSPALKPYGHPDLGSKYQGQTTTTASRYEG